ncbi:MAG: alpha-L-rhamnosidase N-terminal domain-containing protein [Planctomycetota bacterium]|jgi:hypothetical protein
MNWNANWIWLKENKATSTEYAQIRRKFNLESEATCAEVHISANNQYRLFINGTRVGRGPDRSDPRYPYYDSYPVTELLKKGENVITVEAFCIVSKEDRERSWCLYNGEPGVIFQLDLSETETAAGSDAGKTATLEFPCLIHLLK